MKSYVKEYDICLASKAVRHKLYNDLQFFPIPTQQWKDLYMDFFNALPVFINWKGKSYDLILVIIDQLIKMIYYKPVKVIIDTSALTEVIINIVM